MSSNHNKTRTHQRILHIHCHWYHHPSYIIHEDTPLHTSLHNDSEILYTRSMLCFLCMKHNQSYKANSYWYRIGRRLVGTGLRSIVTRRVRSSANISSKQGSHHISHSFPRHTPYTPWIHHPSNTPDRSNKANSVDSQARPDSPYKSYMLLNVYRYSQRIKGDTACTRWCLVPSNNHRRSDMFCSPQ